MIILGKPDGKQKPQMLADRWRDAKAALGNLPRAFGLVWQASRVATLAMALLTLIGAVLPAAQAWAAKLIVDSVVAALNNRLPVDAALGLVMPFLLLEFVLIALGQIQHSARELMQRLLGNRLTETVNVEIMRKALALDLYFFEDAQFYDKLQNARQEASFRSITMVDTSFMLAQNLTTLLSFIVLLITFSPLVALLLFVATLPAFLSQMHHSRHYFSFQMGYTPASRRMMYLSYLLTTDHTAKEIKLFNLGEPLLQRYREMYRKFAREDNRLTRRRVAADTFWNLFGTGAYYGAYAYIIWRTVTGAITLGDMTLYLTIYRQAQGTFSGLLFNLGQLYEGGLFLANLFGFLELQPQVPCAATPRPIPRPITQGIEFRNVSFRYPGKAEWALHSLNLHIAPGEKLALVGANGAGKTTLVKLLTRLYDPNEGQILLDGIDLREYDLHELRERIGVIFQDFVRYHATIRENIGYGQIAALDDTPRLDGAAQRGGADEVVAGLPEGYETMLGRWFDKGHELSGGHWQKIALSRAFMRDGEVLVLDEPTAALDAQHEYEIFQRFRASPQAKSPC